MEREEERERRMIREREREREREMKVAGQWNTCEPLPLVNATATRRRVPLVKANQ